MSRKGRKKHERISGLEGGFQERLDNLDLKSQQTCIGPPFQLIGRNRCRQGKKEARGGYDKIYFLICHEELQEVGRKTWK